MAGGTALNIVPDLCTLDYEIRYLAAEALAPLEARLQAAADRIAGPAAGAIRIDRVAAYPGLDVAADDPVIATLSALLTDPVLTKVGYGTEAGHFHAAVVPTLVCGPGDMDQGHKPDEFIARSQLDACDAMMDRILATLTQGGHLAPEDRKQVSSHNRHSFSMKL
jgi:acetylornithine deacetylase